MNPSISRQNNFDFLRFTLAFIVILFHLLVLSDNASLKWVQPFVNAETAVSAFFIISGFLITNSYANSKTLGRYFKNRASRLLPGYILAVLVCAVSFSMVSVFSFSEYFQSRELIYYLLSNLLFLNFLHPNLPGVFENNPVMSAINGSLWTIKVEVMFYLIVPLIYKTVHKMGIWQRNTALISIYLSAFIYRYLCDYLVLHSSVSQFSELKHQLPGLMNYFIAGMLLYYNFNWIREKMNFSLPVLGLIIVSGHYIMGTDYLFAIGLALIIFWLAFSFPKLNHFAKYGDFSYGIYIFHFPTIQLLISIGFINSTLSWNYLTAILIVLTISLLSWNLVEKHFLTAKMSLPKC